MTKNYLVFFVRYSITISTLLLSLLSFGQKAEIFTLDDFDLTGSVKSCLVTTDYGTEEFNFNENGLLTKLVTRYNDSNYDITYYKFVNEKVSEKRIENYRDGVFDKNTSIATIYVADSTRGEKKIIEKIVSYADEFLDQYEYTYDDQGKLLGIVRNNDQGIENTIIDYSYFNGETTSTYISNGEIKKSIRISQQKTKKNEITSIELTKEYLEGMPNRAVEKVFNVKGKLLKENSFAYDSILESFVPTVLKTYLYNDLGMVSEIKTKIDELEVVKKFIYQFDNGEKGNWIKQIITPDNTYRTRKIKYYDTAVIVE